MTVEQAVALLDSVDEDRADSDPEQWHEEADRVLLAMVPEPVAAAYRRLVERSPWWATA